MFNTVVSHLKNLMIQFKKSSEPVQQSIEPVQQSTEPVFTSVLASLICQGDNILVRGSYFNNAVRQFNVQ